MVNKEKNSVLQVTFSKEIYALLKKEAARRGLTASAFSRMILIEYLQKNAGGRL